MLIYCHPSPADFLEPWKMLAVDLDWFWRGWFYTNDHVDISLDQVKWFKINTENPEIENTILKIKKEQSEVYISDIRNLAAIPNTVWKLILLQ